MQLFEEQSACRCVATMPRPYVPRAGRLLLYAVSRVAACFFDSLLDLSLPLLAMDRLPLHLAQPRWRLLGSEKSLHPPWSPHSSASERGCRLQPSSATNITGCDMIAMLYQNCCLPSATSVSNGMQWRRDDLVDLRDDLLKLRDDLSNQLGGEQWIGMRARGAPVFAACVPA